MSGSFADLRLRLVSALVMVVVGLGTLLAGGWWFLTLTALLSGLMLWELLRMLAPALTGSRAVLLAMVGAAAVFRVGFDGRVVALATLLLAPLLGPLMLRRDRVLFTLYGLAILVASAALFRLRVVGGPDWALWLVLVVVASDVGGYFFGRILGGPRILPRISPKKTWSGTLGGWILAALVGAGFVWLRDFATGVIPLSVLTALAAQLGDVAESAIKRHAGVKDASTLIPGHGGVLDRFDGLVGAALFVAVWFVLVSPGALAMAGAG